MKEQEQLLQAIVALEAQRAVLGDAVVDASVSALREKLAVLPTDTAPERQRKQVTILFADVVDSTRLSRDLDPEMVFEIMDGALRAIGQVVIKHNGMVARLMGDGLLAFFGAPLAREDDPVRAVRAGLEITARADEYAREAAQRWNIGPVNVRVGIHTGPVALGEIGGSSGSEYTAMGDTTNMAARLQSAAPTQGVLISHDTYCLVRGLFESEEQAPIFVKGKDEALTNYLVHSAKRRAFRQGRRGVAGIETSMVGRETEFAILQQALENWQSQGKMKNFIIVGDAGVGKSRLLFEFERWLEQLPHHISIFKGRASLELQGTSIGLIRDVATNRFKIQDSDSLEVVRHKMAAGLGLGQAVNQRTEMQADIVGRWLGFDFSESIHLKGMHDDALQLHNRALMYLVDFLRTVAPFNPSVLLLEDIHWADDSSLDALDAILAELSEQPVFVVATARPSLYRRRPGYGQQWPAVQRIKLGAIQRQDCQKLVRDILQRVHNLPEALCEVIVGRAEGNPFYIEELIKMLIDDGVIIRGTDEWRVEPVELGHVRVPATLTGVLQARLDRLSGEERTVIQQASVIGLRFWDEAVCHLEPENRWENRRATVNQNLDALQEREIVFSRERSTIEEAQEFIFKHTTLRDVAYESVLRQLRRSYHGMAADWLISRTGSRVAEYAALIAEHLELAGRNQEAIVYWRRAGEQAAAQYANGEAVKCFGRSLDLIPAEDQVSRYELLRERELVYALLGAHVRQIQDQLEMRDLAEAMDDLRRQGEVAIREAHLSCSLVDHQETLAAARRAIDFGRRCGDSGIVAASHLYWARSLLRQGQYEEAREHLDDALERTLTPEPNKLRAECLRTQGIAAYFQGELTPAREYWEETLVICRDEQVLDRRGEANTLNNLGAMLADQGDLKTAFVYGQQALAVAREIGSLGDMCSALGNLGSFLIDQGKYTAAIPYLQESIQKSCTAGERYLEANGLTNLGSAHMHLGDMVQAEDNFRQAVSLYQQIEDRRGQSSLLNLTGLMQLWIGDPQTARDSLDQALAVGQEIGSLNSQAQTLTFLGHVFLALGQPDAALESGRKAVAHRQELGELHLVPDALAVQALAKLANGQVTQAQSIVREIIERLAAVPLERGVELCQIYLSCFLVLQETQDPQALGCLKHGYERMQELAAGIENETQRISFLTNIPTNRQIGLEWKKLGA